MDRQRAEMIVNAVHEAWSTRNIERMLSYYAEGIVYTCNGDPAGAPVRYIGRQDMRLFLDQIASVAESVSVVEGFQFQGDTARTTIACYLKHYATGIVLCGQYRQVIRFKGDVIDQLEEFHDAARLTTFWKLVAHTQAMMETQAQSD